MRSPLLSDRLTHFQSLVATQHKLIQSLSEIISTKRDAEAAYRNSLQQLITKIQAHDKKAFGFLHETVGCLVSYLNSLSTNQTILIESCEKEILTAFQSTPTLAFEQKFLKEINEVDANFTNQINRINEVKQKLRDNEGQIKLISVQADFRRSASIATDISKREYQQRLADMNKLRAFNQEQLEIQIDSLMEMSMQHCQLCDELDAIQVNFLTERVERVHDNFVRFFVLQVSFLKSVQFDMTSILSKLNKGDEMKSVTAVSIAEAEGVNKTLRDQIVNSFRSAPAGKLLNLSEAWIEPRLQQKWNMVYEYYCAP